MQDRLEQICRESVKVQQEAFRINRAAILEAVGTIVRAFKDQHKIFIFGNGGSAADSQHIAAEFVGRFQKERRAWPAVALTTDTSCITALGNDYGFDIIFSRQLEALAQAGDVALAISTSGRSGNVITGVRTARKMGLKTIGLTGGDGGELAALTEVRIIVPCDNTARIQESHHSILHGICELVEDQLA